MSRSGVDLGRGVGLERLVGVVGLGLVSVLLPVLPHLHGTQRRGGDGGEANDLGGAWVVQGEGLEAGRLLGLGLDGLLGLGDGPDHGLGHDFSPFD